MVMYLPCLFPALPGTTQQILAESSSQETSNEIDYYSHVMLFGMVASGLLSTF